MSHYTEDELNDMVILPEPHDHPSVPMDADKLAAEVTDRLLNALPAVLFAEMRDGDWSDPWGEMMGWWFALNDVCYALELPCHESYGPGAFGLDGIDTEDYRYGVIFTGILIQEPPTDETVNEWHKLFDTAYHALKLLGKDY